TPARPAAGVRRRVRTADVRTARPASPSPSRGVPLRVLPRGLRLRPAYGRREDVRKAGTQIWRPSGEKRVIGPPGCSVGQAWDEPKAGVVVKRADR
ncbi:hypothetical protein THAOC_09065, partial [Thalassiosira oceanica]